MAEVLNQLQAKAPSPAVAAASSASSAIVVKRHRELDGNVVQVRVETLRQISDDLNRSHNAIKQAQRLSQAAANAFSEEAEVISQSKLVVEQLMRS